MNQTSPNAPAVLDSPRAFMSGGGGLWAGLRMLQAFNNGEGLHPGVLRTADTLRRDEWKFFDNALVEGALLRMPGVQWLKQRGLTKTVTNAMAKTIYQWEKIGDMNPAIVSLDGVTRSENDTVEFTLEGLPLPIIHKDWYLNLRRLDASRSGQGEALDDTYTRISGRKIGEMEEDLLFNGSVQFLGLKIYGLRTHPDRATSAFGSGGNWGAGAKTGAQMIADIGTAQTELEARGFYGPYVIFYGGDASVKFGDDYKTESDRTIRERIMALEKVQDLVLSDAMPDGEIVIAQATDDVMAIIEGEPLQTVQWDVHGGFQINFKGFQIEVPLIRANADGDAGIFHFA